ncbi:NB-ARC domain [Seminavis robusta]|uniref:NB-ARC domain n=1 Tax=Seminavis robusta TaxID=568900 RepID=A0A9N8DWG4_9STRA|nr:NB-ARC domain [Seminavis robusta]|eukprot:Sro395_g133980.1 NB-ARC domain (651) ;mRNA; f:11277-13229
MMSQFEALMEEQERDDHSLKELSRYLCQTSSDLCPRGDDANGVELETVVSWAGIPLSWFLQVFIPLPEISCMMDFGCPMWFVRDYGIPTLLGKRGIHTGALADHLDVFGASAKQEKATLFCSYTGAHTLSRFVQVMKRLHEKQEEAVVWIDVFSVDQVAWRNLCDRGEATRALRKLLMDELPIRIGTLKQTVLCLDQWEDPMHALGKIWVLWEVYLTVIEGGSLEVIFPGQEDEGFLDSFQSKCDEILYQLSRIDVAKAKASKEADRIAILDRMNQSNGVHQVNKTIIRLMKHWILQLAGDLYESHTVSGKHTHSSLLLGNNMAFLHKHMGNTSAATSIYEQTLIGMRQHLGENHPHTLTCMHNLAISILDLDMSQKALDGRRKVLGPDHEHTLSSMSGVAVCLRVDGKLKEAIQHQRHVVSVGKKVLGLGHPYIIDWMSLLASLLEYNGELAEAEVLHRGVLEHGSRLFLERTSPVIETKTCLGRNLATQGRYAEAAALQREVVQISLELQPKESTTFMSMSLLAVSLASLGETSEAAKLHQDSAKLQQEAVEGLLRTEGSDHPRTMKTLSDAAEFFRVQGRLVVAKSYYLLLSASLERCCDDPPAEFPGSMPIIMCNCGRLLHQLGSLEDAEAYYEKALHGSSESDPS